ncbi:MAG: hypothetical protein PVSMB8_00430 [Vulcanimicrobiaceae bacterium]
MGEGQTPGDGKSSPFGNHKGDTQSMANAATGGRDFTKEHHGAGTLGTPDNSLDKDSIPAGGPILKPDPTPVSEKVAGPSGGPVPSKPYKL